MAVTDARGEFTIRDVPPGIHQFIIWHERPGYLEKRIAVTVTAGQDTRLDLFYGPEKFKLD